MLFIYPSNRQDNLPTRSSQACMGNEGVSQLSRLTLPSHL